jgi:5-dehydro-2-deoxygluconokinase
MGKAITGEQKTLDVICLGRVAVDLYGQQIGSRLEDMTTFSKYLGGSSGNVAYGTAIQDCAPGCWRASAMNIWGVLFARS